MERTKYWDSALNEWVEISPTVEEFETHKADLTYQVATGTATALTVPMETLVNGYSKTFIASVTSTSTAKTINGKKFYKPGTTVSPSLIAGKAYTVWYNATSDCFFIKASAEGTATAAQVLAGVPFSNDDDTGIIGTMVNRANWTSILGAPGTVAIPAGFHNGNGWVTANYAPNNLATGVIPAMHKNEFQSFTIYTNFKPLVVFGTPAFGGPVGAAIINGTQKQITASSTPNITVSLFDASVRFSIPASGYSGSTADISYVIGG